MRHLLDLVNRIGYFFRGLEANCKIQKESCSNIPTIIEKSKNESCVRSKTCPDTHDVEKTGFYVSPSDYNEHQPVYYGYHDDKPDRWGHS